MKSTSKKRSRSATSGKSKGGKSMRSSRKSSGAKYSALRETEVPDDEIEMVDLN